MELKPPETMPRALWGCEVDQDSCTCICHGDEWVSYQALLEHQVQHFAEQFRGAMAQCLVLHTRLNEDEGFRRERRRLLKKERRLERLSQRLERLKLVLHIRQIRLREEQKDMIQRERRLTRLLDEEGVMLD